MKFDQERYRPDLHDAMGEFSSLVFDAPGFEQATFRFRDAIGPGENRELSMRPVVIGADALWQVTRADKSENLPHGRAKKRLWELINSSNILEEAHASGGGSALHMRTTKKGHVLFDRVKADGSRTPRPAPAAAEPAAAAAHDHVKDYPLTRFDSKALLIALGFATSAGDLKPSMHAKFRQVNEFLRILDSAVDEISTSKRAPEKLGIVDCGCGKSYLSFAAKAYLEAVRGIPVHLTGIDLKEQVIAFCRRTADALGWSESARFETADIAKFKPAEKPDVVLSLHACDTATDEAMAFGVENGARVILSAPCCQHELQKSLAQMDRPHRALLRNGILRERFADILTDAFRAQILRVCGYRATVVEFVEPEATARNILIRASRVTRAGTGTALADYQDLREAWKCTPYLATRLSATVPELANEQ